MANITLKELNSVLANSGGTINVIRNVNNKLLYFKKNPAEYVGDLGIQADGGNIPIQIKYNSSDKSSFCVHISNVASTKHYFYYFKCASGVWSVSKLVLTYAKAVDVSWAISSNGILCYSVITAASVLNSYTVGDLVSGTAFQSGYWNCYQANMNDTTPVAYTIDSMKDASSSSSACVVSAVNDDGTLYTIKVYNVSNSVYYNYKIDKYTITSSNGWNTSPATVCIGRIKVDWYQITSSTTYGEFMIKAFGSTDAFGASATNRYFNVLGVFTDARISNNPSFIAIITDSKKVIYNSSSYSSDKIYAFTVIGVMSAGIAIGTPSTRMYDVDGYKILRFCTFDSFVDNYGTTHYPLYTYSLPGYVNILRNALNHTSICGDHIPAIEVNAANTYFSINGQLSGSRYVELFSVSNTIKATIANVYNSTALSQLQWVNVSDGQIYDSQTINDTIAWFTCSTGMFLITKGGKLYYYAK